MEVYLIKYCCFFEHRNRFMIIN